MMGIAKLKMLLSMLIFGTVGIFVHYIPLPSAVIAFFRAVLGALFMLGMMLAMGKKPSLQAIRKNIWLLLISGVVLGGNWVLLFEAYRYTTVAGATACYYLAPVFLVLAAPLLKERLTLRKLLCAGVAFGGMVCVSGVLTQAAPDLTGIFLAVGAAVLYALVMILNKKLTDISAYDKTAVQLAVAAVFIGIYLAFSGQLQFPRLQIPQWLLLILVGIVHTGIAYWLYFGSMGQLTAQTVALFSYLDPVTAIVLSALWLRQPMDAWGMIGSVLILGSALYSELKKEPV